MKGSRVGLGVRRKTDILTLSLCAVLGSNCYEGSAQPFLEVPTAIAPVETLQWVDCDNDGDLDVFASGVYPSRPTARIFLNEGPAGFSDTGQDLKISGEAVWADFDQDGDLDVILAGQYVWQEHGTYWLSGYTNGLFFNDGLGNFTRADATLPHCRSLSAGDVDNDGDADAVWQPWPTQSARGGLLLNDGLGGFAAVSSSVGSKMYGQNQWKDFDRDGDLDVLIDEAGGARPKTRLFRNHGALEFEELPIGFGNGALRTQWEDFDRDGYPDIFCRHYDQTSGGVTQVLLRNERDGRFTRTSVALPGSAGSSSCADYDNDGDWDIYFPGHYTNTVLQRLYRNAGPLQFVAESTAFPSWNQARAAWGNYDNDGSIDLLLFGYVSNWTARVALFRNARANGLNTPPAAPGGLQAQQVGDRLLFRWNPAQDAQTPAANITYELRVGTVPGGHDIVAPSSNPQTGYRRLPEPGPALTNAWGLRGFGRGTYFWSVQAIDTGMQGSPWAGEQQFTVTNTPPVIEVTNQIRLGPSGVGTLALAVGDDESPASDLTMAAQTADPTFVPSSSFVFGGSGSQRTLQFRVGAGKLGSTILTITVRDPQGLFAEARVQVVSEFFTEQRAILNTNYLQVAPYFGSPVGDFDKDGDLDVFVSGMYWSNNMQMWFQAIAANDGQGTFTFEPLNHVASGSDGVHLDDFDRDDDLDILWRGPMTTGMSNQAFINPGNGVFGAPVTLGLSGFAVFGDTDEDGDTDAVAQREQGNPGTARAVYLYENFAGAFRPRLGPAVALAYGNYSPSRLSDLDHDGDVDYVVADYGYTPERTYAIMARVLRNTGTRGFTHEIAGLYEPGSYYNVHFIDDTDDDGDLDIGFSYEVTNVFHWALFVNDGLGHFGSQPVPKLPSPFAADFDNDGDRDRFVGELVSTEPFLTVLRLHLNNGGGVYTPTAFVISHSGYAADFDDDGDLDYIASAVTRDEYGQTVSGPDLRFYRNNTDRPNAAPPPPAGLRAMQQADDRVTFTWDPATDDHTPPAHVSYNIRVGTTSGGVDIIAPSGNVSNGRRWIPSPGNAGSELFRHVRFLPAGTYYWSVQAIDGAFIASPWAPEQSITINKPAISLILDVTTPPGEVSAPIQFNVDGGSSSLEQLQITTTADDPTLIPDTGFTVSGSGSVRTLTIRPGNRSGDTDVTLTATDGAGFSTSMRFHVRVSWWDTRPLEQAGIQRFEQWHWADLDTDGWLDVIGYAPEGTAWPRLFSYRNLGNATFLAVSNNLLPYTQTPVYLGGFPGDDFADVLTLELPGSSRAAWTVWRGTGGFDFSPMSHPTNDALVYEHRWVDLDADGIRDVIHGWSNFSSGSNGLAIARGRPDGTFTYVEQRLRMYSVFGIATADFDADGDFDLLVSGRDYAPFNSAGTNFTRLYRNDGFARFTGSTNGLPQGVAYYPSVADVNRDGLPDLLLIPSNPSRDPALKGRLFHNSGGEFTQASANLPSELNVPSWIDYDNDGDPDLLAVTRESLPPIDDQPFRAATFRNDGGVLVPADTGLPSIVAHQAEVADADNDSDADFFISGETGWNRTGRFLCLNTSPRPNTPPAAPGNLRTEPIVDATVFEWTPVPDAESGIGLTYNLRVGVTPGGSEIMSAIADPSTGQRRLTGPGNIGHAPRWRLRLPEGRYYWTVQSVDAGYAASGFAPEQTFVVSRPLISAISNQVLVPYQSTPPLAFSISNGTPPFAVTVSSSDPSMIPQSGLMLGGSGSQRTLVVHPAPGRYGTATITIVVRDAEQGSTSTSFQVTVLPPFTFASGMGSPAAFGSLAWGDADRDDDLDLLLTGSRYDSFGFRASILRNDRSGVLSQSLAEFTGVYRGDGAWGDFDRDGDLDALVSGFASGPGQGASTSLHRNNFPNAFTPVSLTRLPSLGDSALAWADADGDGDLDVLICGSSSSGVRQAALFLSHGTGSFSNALLTLPPLSEGAVGWADYDLDGDADFVICGSTDGTSAGAATRLYRNEGRAVFVEQSNSLPAVFKSALAWADFDSDGDPDLVIAGLSRNGAITQLFRNNSGTLTATSILLPGVADGALAWGDANRDGFPDLALSGRTVSGTLISQVYWAGPSALTNAGVELPGVHFSSMAWGDLDFDAALDLALAGSTNTALNLNAGAAYSAVFHNNLILSNAAPAAPANLVAQVAGSDVLLSWSMPQPSVPGLTFELRVGRSPGARDVMSPHANPGTGVRHVAQGGMVGASGRWRLQNLAPGTYYWSVQGVDAAFRGSSFSAERQFSIFNLQPTIAGITNQTMLMNSSLGPLEFSVSDPDGDPAALIVTATSSDSELFPEGAIVLSGSGALRSVIFNPSANAAGNATIIFTVADPEAGVSTASARVTVQSLPDAQAGFTDGQFSILEPADVDNDGDLDVLLAGTELVSPGSGRSSVRLFLNDGTGAFAPITPTLPPVFDGAFAAWGDYDGDGDLDLFYNGTLYGQDNGTFFFAASPLPGIRNGQAAWADYDADGDLDLAVTGAASDLTTRIYRNDGEAFTDIAAPLLPLHYSSLAWGDPDNDGDLDLAVAGAASINTSLSANGRIYRNEGADRFVERHSFLGVVSGNLIWADVNNDGRADLATIGTHGAETINRLLLNVGQWDFTALPLQSGGTAWRDTRLLDWDADGDVDLLGGVNSVIAVYLNLGAGVFADQTSASLSSRCRSLRWGDFDNDSDFDVLVSNTGTSSFTGNTRLYRNLWVDQQPAAPDTLTGAVDRNTVLLRWPEISTVSSAPVTYNVRVGTAPGLGDVLSPLSREDGRRLVPLPGNAGFAHSLALRELLPGTYFWSVQAVDISWHGLPWLPEATFQITSPLVIRITSVQSLDPARVKIAFQAPAGRRIVPQVSTDLITWTDRSAIEVNITGAGEFELTVSGPHNFFRLLLQD